MKKIFLATLFALIVGVQNFCGAATISEARNDEFENVIYPVVHVADSAIEQKINLEIRTEISRFLTAVYNDSRVNGMKIGDVHTSYEIGSNESGGTVILSIVLTESYYLEFRAHPNTVKHALNFNTSSGSLMGMDYLTDVGEGVSTEVFRERIERALNEYCAREEIQLFDDALPLKNLPENFYWDDKLNLHFIFNHYEIAPYAMGIIDVDIDS